MQWTSNQKNKFLKTRTININENYYKKTIICKDIPNLYQFIDCLIFNKTFNSFHFLKELIEINPVIVSGPKNKRFRTYIKINK